MDSHDSQIILCFSMDCSHKSGSGGISLLHADFITDSACLLITPQAGQHRSLQDTSPWEILSATQ